MDSLTFADYKDFVLLKAAPENPVENWHLIHGALGLSTEVLELATAETQENIVEELGDICWYLTLLSASIHHVPHFSYQEELCSVAKFMVITEEVVSEIKKIEIYKAVRPPLHRLLDEIWTAFQQLCLYVTAEESPFPTMRRNMDKLNYRYESEFTTHESQERKDKQ